MRQSLRRRPDPIARRPIQLLFSDLNRIEYFDGKIHGKFYRPAFQAIGVGFSVSWGIRQTVIGLRSESSNRAHLAGLPAASPSTIHMLKN